MFLEFYNLRENPFGVTPDPRFLYLGESHRKAFASLLYAVENKRGFSALIAEPGMGKTSLLFRMLDSLQDKARTAFLFQTVGDSRELLHTMLFDLGIKCASEDPAVMRDTLNGNLLQALREGRDVVVVIDEAQNLDPKILETVRQLSNFETTREKLMHIVLAGQPGLAQKLADPSMTQLRQRVSCINHLEPLRNDEVVQYVTHRLRTAGREGPSPVFSADALALIAQTSQGIPRDINNLCFRALTIGFELESAMINSNIVRQVISELQLAPAPPQRPPIPAAPEPPPFLRLGAEPEPVPASLDAYARRSAWEEAQGLPAPSSSWKKWAVAVACFVAIPSAILALSDTRLGLTDTWPGEISSRAVKAVLDSTGSNAVGLAPTRPERPASPAPPATSQVQTGSAPSGSGQAAGSGGPRMPSVPDVSGNSGDLKRGEPRTSGGERRQRESPSSDAVTATNQSHTEAGLRDEGARPRVGATGAHPSTVQVLRPETVFQLAVELYGHSNWIIVEALCAANPEIHDPYAVLNAGQTIRLPSDLVTVTQNYNSSRGSNRRTR